MLKLYPLLVVFLVLACADATGPHLVELPSAETTGNAVGSGIKAGVRFLLASIGLAG